MLHWAEEEVSPESAPGGQGIEFGSRRLTDVPQIPLHLYLSLYHSLFRKDKMQITQGFHMKTELGDVEARLRVSAVNSLSF